MPVSERSSDNEFTDLAEGVKVALEGLAGYVGRVEAERDELRTEVHRSRAEVERLRGANERQADEIDRLRDWIARAADAS